MKFRTMTSVAAIAAASFAFSALSAGAHAQTATPPTPPAAAAGDQGIQDIIVTASRREQTLQRTAIPVTALTAEALAERGVTKVEELTTLAPSLKVGTNGGGAIQITARGVGNFGGNNFNEPGVSVNLDGAYLARSFSANGIFFDVARVEVLKGPQGTLYGRNSTGGVLNVLTNDPTSALGGDLTLEAGNFGLKRASGALNVPIADGIALRISGQGIERDGYLSDGYNDDKGYAGRIKLKLDPMPQLSILLEAAYAKTKGQGSAFVFSPFVDPNDPYVGPSDPRSNAIIAATPGLGPLLSKIKNDGFLNNTDRALQGTVNYDFGSAKATLIVANHRDTLNYRQYSAGFPIVDDTRKTPNYYTTVELRLGSSSNGPFKWVVGGFFYKDDFATNVFVNQGFTFADSRNLTIHTTSYSGFGEATYSVAPTVRLTAGGRYTSDEKSLDGVTLSPISPAAPCNAPSTVMVDVVRGTVCSASDVGAATFSKFTYKLGAEVDLGPHSLLYANYSTGFKSGGFFASPNFNAAGAFPSNAYRPETISAWTIGSKNRFFDNILQVNIEGYYWKYKDKQVSHLGFVPPNNQILLVDNAGNATIYGVEVDAQLKPTHHDEFAVTVQYLHSKYDTFSYKALVAGYAAPAPFPGAPVPGPVTGCAFSPTMGIGGAARGTGVPGQSTVDCSGRVLSLAPTWSVNLNYRHTFELPGGSRIVPSVGAHIESGFWVGEEYFLGQYQKAFTMTDLNLTWFSPKNTFSLTGYVTNVENSTVGQTAVLSQTVGKPLISLRPPRTFGARASVHF